MIYSSAGKVRGSGAFNWKLKVEEGYLYKRYTDLKKHGI